MRLFLNEGIVNVNPGCYNNKDETHEPMGGNDTGNGAQTYARCRQRFFSHFESLRVARIALRPGETSGLHLPYGTVNNQEQEETQ